MEKQHFMSADAAVRAIGRRASGFAIAAAMIAISGCYIFSPSQQAVEARHAEMHFDLSQCEPVQANVYKCPAVDKAICGREYSGPPIDCLAIDSKGNLLVEVR
jgi:hypothetical protein